MWELGGLDEVGNKCSGYREAETTKQYRTEAWEARRADGVSEERCMPGTCAFTVGHVMSTATAAKYNASAAERVMDEKADPDRKIPDCAIVTSPIYFFLQGAPSTSCYCSLGAPASGQHQVSRYKRDC